MATVAGLRVVAISTYTGMLRIGCAFCMTVGAGKYRKIAGVRMTLRTGKSGVMPRCNREPRMVEDSLVPGCIRSLVAILASGWEACCFMVWIVG